VLLLSLFGFTSILLFKLVIKIPSGKLLFILTSKDFRSELVLFETLIDKTFSPYFNLTGIEEFAKKSKETKKNEASNKV